MSSELKSYLTSQGIATSRTTAYNPAENGQVERYNGIIWKTIELALKSRGLGIQQWAMVLQPALHSIRSLLCTATNATPHERMFTHARKSHHGFSLPTWLTTPGTILMKNNNRGNKYEPLVQEVELIEANPEYAHVKLPNGNETSVSLRHLAPSGVVTRNQDVTDHSEDRSSVQTDKENGNGISILNPSDDTSHRPTRVRRPPEYLKDYVTDN